MTWLQAHEYMTSAELGRTFQVDHPDDGEFDPLLINCWRSVKMPLWPDVRKKGIVRFPNCLHLECLKT